MNDTLTLCLEILFWFALFVVFYTYLGYGILLYILVKLKEFFVKPVRRSLPATDGGTAGGDAVYHGFQRRGGGGREDGELP